MNRRSFLKLLGVGTVTTVVIGSGLWSPEKIKILIGCDTGTPIYHITTGGLADEYARQLSIHQSELMAMQQSFLTMDEPTTLRAFRRHLQQHEDHIRREPRIPGGSLDSLSGMPVYVQGPRGSGACQPRKVWPHKGAPS